MSLSRHPLPRALLLDLDNTAYAYAPSHEAGLASAQRLAAQIHERWRSAPLFAADYARARDEVKARTHSALSHCRFHYFKTMVERERGRSELPLVVSLHDAYWAGYLGAAKVDSGCRDALIEWRRMGIGLAWVTNFTTVAQCRKLRALKLEELADWLVTSEEAGADKPSPLPFRLALSRAGVAPEETWVVGDDLEADVKPALELGMTAVWYRRPEEKGSAPAGALTVTGWEELRGLLAPSQKKAA